MHTIFGCAFTDTIRIDTQVSLSCAGKNEIVCLYVTQHVQSAVQIGVIIFNRYAFTNTNINKSS